jgi:predicted CoA-binding protein
MTPVLHARSFGTASLEDDVNSYSDFHRTKRITPSRIALGCAKILRMAASPLFDPITEFLKKSRTIAVVGLSDSPLRPSHGVSAYMQTHGYRIIPVNPQINEALGEKSYASLLDVPVKIDVVNIFRRPEYVEEIVDQAIQLKVPFIWMQEQVIHEKAAEKARKAGIFVVMDQCILKEHRARFR